MIAPSRSATLRRISAVRPLPATPAHEPGPPKHRRTPPTGRDHALALHRSLGAIQILGGGTLLAAYSSGGQTADIPAATTLILTLATLQVAAGALLLAFPRPLQRTLKRAPGTYVALLLALATAVTALGGSNAATLWVTSAQCLMIAAGAALPGLRLLAAATLVTLTAATAWILADGTTGGYDADGDYLIATLAMAKVIVVGAWLGRGVGIAMTLLSRWHVIELHERGAVGHLREHLTRIDAKATTLGHALGNIARPSTELSALRARLRRGVDLPEAGTAVRIAEIVAELVAEHVDRASGPELIPAVPPGIDALPVDAVMAAEIGAVARRQIDNVVRHAPNATTITLLIDRDGDHLTVQLTDDGGGTAPTRTGAGTAWSARQLARSGGSTRYFDAPAGVGLEVLLPLTSTPELPDAPTLSVAEGVRRFGQNLFVPLRWAGYIGDTVYAQSIDGIGERWLLMPIGAILIEYAMQRGLPGLRLDRHHRTLLASGLVVALVAAFTVPAGSPDELIPVTTSVVVIADLLLIRRRTTWALVEIARLAAYLPLLLTVGASTLTYGVVYPWLFYAVAAGLTLFLSRAETLEQTALDAVGRAALASATVRGLALHHDAVNVILRAAPGTPEVTEAGLQLERAIADLAARMEPTLDPRDVVTGALEAMHVPVITDPDPDDGRRRRPRGQQVAGALDRIALVEMASLAADERASCAPPGLLGRRRLRALHATWDDAGRAVALRLRAEPQLGPPDPATVAELERVGRALGVTVQSSPDELLLTYRG